MALWRISVTRRVCFSGMLIEPGMEVEITSQMYDSMNRLPIVCNKAINEAFKRKYDIDLERAELLSPLYLEARLMGEEEKKMSNGASLFAMLTDIFIQ